MPLHLLGKKSWNVYNADNIEKVRRDEARAKAQEEAEDERKQELDAKRRLQILRGETPEPIRDAEHRREDRSDNHNKRDGRERRSRKRVGEDDTDYELRIADQKIQKLATSTQFTSRSAVDAPLVDRQGHIDLFPQKKPSKVAEKAIEATNELAKRKKDYADDYTVKFSDAAGYNQNLDSPWYSKNSSRQDDLDILSKDMWGNEDPRRKERETARTMSNDPLAIMRVGSKKAHDYEKVRKLLKEEQDNRLAQLKREQRAEKRKRRHDDGEDFLERSDFNVAEKRLKHDGRSSRRSSSNSRPRRERSRNRDYALHG